MLLFYNDAIFILVTLSQCVTVPHNIRIIYEAGYVTKLNYKNK